VSDWETGKREIGLIMPQVIARRLNATMATLLTGLEANRLGMHRLPVLETLNLPSF